MSGRASLVFRAGHIAARRPLPHGPGAFVCRGMSLRGPGIRRRMRLPQPISGKAARNGCGSLPCKRFNFPAGAIAGRAGSHTCRRHRTTHVNRKPSNRKPVPNQPTSQPANQPTSQPANKPANQQPANLLPKPAPAENGKRKAETVSPIPSPAPCRAPPADKTPAPAPCRHRSGVRPWPRAGRPR